MWFKPDIQVRLEEEGTKAVINSNHILNLNPHDSHSGYDLVVVSLVN